MAMSKDRVLFFLPRRYFLKEYSANYKPKGLKRNECVKVLQQSFGVQGGRGIDMLHQLMEANPDGFYIRCRPSQFARFIIYRMEALAATTESSNGVRDLQPILEQDNDPREEIAKAMSIGVSCVNGVLAALDMTVEDAYNHIKGTTRQYNADVVDFSRNAAWDKGEML